jgi:hypothetical protein
LPAVIPYESRFEGSTIVLARARLHRLQKKTDSDVVLKGRGFSRAVSIAKSMPALAAEDGCDEQCDFFRSLFSRADPCQ